MTNGDEPRLRLPEAHRAELKAPLGSVHTDVETALAGASGPIIAIGDVVTHDLLEAGRPPDVAVVDGRTERSPVDGAIEERVMRDVTDEVSNPAATITASLLEILEDAIDDDGRRTIRVEGEEDLAVLPAVVLAPTAATVVYGQPGEGLVVVSVDAPTRERVLDLLEHFDGDTDQLLPLRG